MRDTLKETCGFAEEDKVCGTCHHFSAEGMSGFCTIEPASQVSSVSLERDKKGRVTRKQYRYSQPIMHCTGRCSKWELGPELVAF